jgi:tetratricopeptide (TPR) repeat protein
VKKPQWITTGLAVLLFAAIFIFGRTVPEKKPIVPKMMPRAESMPENKTDVSINSILAIEKKLLSSGQVARLNNLEQSITGQAEKDHQLRIYDQLARFWADTARIFDPYAWYKAEAARLENSEKSLTFAAHLFLDNLQTEDNERRLWRALQAKDLFERSLKINPENDSSKVGLGACYLFGGISPAPMVGITKIREVVEKDSTNIYAQMMLIQGLLLSGQYDKAITRLQTVIRLEPANAEAILRLADLYDRIADKANAIIWYRKSLQYVERAEARAEIEKRISNLSK